MPLRNNRFALTPRLHHMAKVAPRPVSWLWPGRIPAGKITVIAGEPGVGKSSVVTHLAAIVSANQTWPDHDWVDQPKIQSDPPELASGVDPDVAALVPLVYFLASEDRPADTIRPRLDALGAEPKHIFVMNHGVPVTDVAYIDEILTGIQCCRLMIIDPIATFLGSLNASRNTAVHEWFARLADVAERHNTAIVCVTHLSRRSTGPALSRVQGCLAFTAAARCVWLITTDPNDPDRRLFLPAKNNLGPDKGGLAFRLEASPPHPDVAIPVWEPDPVEETADRILAAPTDYSAVVEAQSWLTAQLSPGPVATKDLRQQAQQDGLSWRTIERAKGKMDVIANQIHPNGNEPRFWTWSLTSHPDRKTSP